MLYPSASSALVSPLSSRSFSRCFMGYRSPLGGINLAPYPPLKFVYLVFYHPRSPFTPLPREQHCTDVAWPRKGLWALSIPLWQSWHFSLQLAPELPPKPPLNGSALQIRGNNLQFSAADDFGRKSAFWQLLPFHCAFLFLKERRPFVFNLSINNRGKHSWGAQCDFYRTFIFRNPISVTTYVWNHSDIK